MDAIEKVMKTQEMIALALKLMANLNDFSCFMNGADDWFVNIESKFISNDIFYLDFIHHQIVLHEKNIEVKQEKND